MKVIIISRDEEFKEAFSKFFDSEGYSVEKHSTLSTFVDPSRKKYIFYDQFNNDEPIDGSKIKEKVGAGRITLLTNNKEQFSRSCPSSSVFFDEIISKPISNEYLLSRVRAYYTKESEPEEKSTNTSNAANNHNSTVNDSMFFSLLSSLATIRESIRANRDYKVDEFLSISNQIFYYLYQNSSHVSHYKLTQDEFTKTIQKSFEIRLVVNSPNVRYIVDTKYFIHVFYYMISSALLAHVEPEDINLSLNLNGTQYIASLNITVNDPLAKLKCDEIIKSNCWRAILNLNNIDYTIHTDLANYKIEMMIPFEMATSI